MGRQGVRPSAALALYSTVPTSTLKIHLEEAAEPVYSSHGLTFSIIKRSAGVRRLRAAQHSMPSFMCTAGSERCADISSRSNERPTVCADKHNLQKLSDLQTWPESCFRAQS